MIIGIVVAVSVAMSFIRKYERNEERVKQQEKKLEAWRCIFHVDEPKPGMAQDLRTMVVFSRTMRIWHDASDRPEYAADSRSNNQILVFGPTENGGKCSVCTLMESGAVYTPLNHELYQWGQCHFTKWAYVDELLPRDDYADIMKHAMSPEEFRQLTTGDFKVKQ